MKIVFIPLDKRPYNYSFLYSFSDLKTDIEIVLPKSEDLGYRKDPANIYALDQFLFNQMDVDAFVISAEMLIYGGLFASRIHHLSDEKIQNRLDIFRKLKEKFPKAKIYVANLIMRNPSYSSSEEEPNYYAIYGADIFRWGVLKDKYDQHPSQETLKEWELVNKSIDKSSLNDYLERRELNLKTTESIINLTDEQIIDVLFIPRDDTAEFGLGSMDRKKVFSQIQGKKCIYSHPGTDEAMCTLMARAYNDFYQKTPKIYSIFSNGDAFIPKYEDISLSKSIESQINLIGGVISNNLEESDILLAIHTPYQKMDEARNQEASESHKKSLDHFLSLLRSFDKPFILTDAAYANGGDSELITLLDEHFLLEKCLAYAGWNTTGNSLGTSLSQAVFTIEPYDHQKATTNLLERLLSDWIYQAIVRWDIEKNDLPTLGASYSQFNGKDRNILEIVKIKTLSEWRKNIKNSFLNDSLDHLFVSAPFKRMSGLDFQLTNHK
ncbi:MAG: DUF4127 family protein [Brevinema sp.]